MTILKALHDVLAADPELAAFLSSYQGAPAVFTARPVPDGAVEPYIILGASIASTNVGPLAGAELLKSQSRDVLLIAKASGSVIQLDAAAERIASLLASRLLDVPGFRRVRCTVSNGPVELPADDESYGRVVSLALRLVV